VTLRRLGAAILLTVVIAQGADEVITRVRLGKASYDFAVGCGEETGASAGKGVFTGHARRECGEGLPGVGGSPGPVVVTRTVDCGPPQVAGQLRPDPGDVCGQVRNLCDAATSAQLPTDPTITTTASEQRNPDGTWRLIGTDCLVQGARPQVTALLVMQQLRKLVPHPAIGVAPPGGATLVNIQTLLWAETPAEQSLGTVTLLGHRVALRVRVDRVDWDFGDGSTDTTDTPEPRYDPADGCRTVTCPGYWGHVYRATGSTRVTATVTWSGRYRVDGGAWQDIPDTVTGPAATTDLVVRQARGILVPAH
jgi:hypothetical protein